jgi:hypothetical protein
VRQGSPAASTATTIVAGGGYRQGSPAAASAALAAAASASSSPTVGGRQPTAGSAWLRMEGGSEVLHRTAVGFYGHDGGDDANEEEEEEEHMERMQRQQRREEEQEEEELLSFPLVQQQQGGSSALPWLQQSWFRDPSVQAAGDDQQPLPDQYPHPHLLLPEQHQPHPHLQGEASPSSPEPQDALTFKTTSRLDMLLTPVHSWFLNPAYSSRTAATATAGHSPSRPPAHASATSPAASRAGAAAERAGSRGGSPGRGSTLLNNYMQLPEVALQPLPSDPSTSRHQQHQHQQTSPSPSPHNNQHNLPDRQQPPHSHELQHSGLEERILSLEQVLLRHVEGLSARVSTSEQEAG